jgi:hypothetical protein
MAIGDGTGTKRDNGGKINNQEKGTGITGLDQEWVGILRDLSWIQEG